MITATVPAARVCRNCRKAESGCRERNDCVDYAVERIVRGLALVENRKKRGVEYDMRRNAVRSGRMKERQM